MDNIKFVILSFSYTFRCEFSVENKTFKYIVFVKILKNNSISIVYRNGTKRL
jgi:hypothetical protein